jgi:stress response protein YsnF
MRSDDPDPPSPAEAPPEAEPLVIVEERLRVETRARVVGRVRVRAVTETVEALARADLAGEAVEVTRVPIGLPIEAAPEIRVEGEVTILPIVEEELVVSTRLVLREEIHVRRRPTRETVELPVPLRRQRAIIERVEPEAGGAPAEPPQPSEDET